MEIEVFKLLIYSYGFDAEAVHRQCFPSFCQTLIEKYGIEPNPALFSEWLMELKDKITSFQIVADDEATVTELILSLNEDALVKEKNLVMKETG